MQTQNNSKKISIKKELVRYWLLLGIVLLCLLFGLLNPKFLSISNLLSILSNSCISSIAAIGVCVLFITGEIDYSCGMEFFTASVVIGKLCDKEMFRSTTGYLLACLAALIVCLIYGAVNAFLHIKIGIPAFIATLGTSLAVDGFLRIRLGNASITSGRWPDVFNYLGQGYISIIPVMVIVLLIIGGLMWFYSERTANGKRMYAIGSNATACEYVGIKVGVQKLQAFLICALLNGLAGIIYISMLNVTTPGVGDSVLFNSLTSIMVGATFLHIGVFNIPGAIISTIFTQIIINGLSILGVSNYYRNITQGFILIIAVSVVTIIRKRRATSSD